MLLCITSVSLFVHLRNPHLGCVFPLELTQSRKSLTDTLQGLWDGACQVESLDYLSQWGVWRTEVALSSSLAPTDVTVTQGCFHSISGIQVLVL